jgi:phage antirepressor YoqD-like protein
MKRDNSELTFSIAEVAKMTNFPGGEHKFFAWLRKYGYLLENNQPSQVQMKRKWFVLESKVHYGIMVRRTIPVARVTIKGLAGLERVIKKAFPICPPCEKQTN